MISLLGAGSASFTRPGREHVLEEGKTYWFDYEATRRGAVLVPRHERKNVAISAGPSPDGALSIVDKNVTDAFLKMATATELSTQEARFEAERRLVETMKETPGLIHAYKERLRKNQ